jgi:Zn-dependent protease with chaperone function
MGGLLLWIPYRLVKTSPRRWWLWTSVLAIPVAAFFLLLAPVVIDPLFNKFGPMKDKILEGKILDLAGRAGIEGARVFEVDKSADTNTVNAYVTGFSGSKRIVLWDTTIAKLAPDEVLFVMGHEMGHYVLGHVVKSIFFAAALILVTLYAAYRLQAGLIARFSSRFGFTELADVASLPLVMLLIGVLSFVVTPVAAGYSRWQEHEADRFGLEITRNNHAAATAFVKLQQENLGVPRRGLLYKLWRADHPLLGDRIDFCNTYRPWEEGRPGRYEHLFKR